MVKKIAGKGHEIGCHSYSHRLVYNLTPDEFREDTRQAKDILEQITGTKVNGYRAPSYSITKRSLWALDILAELGFQYDSSIFPIYHDRYGISDSPRFSYKLPKQDMTEYPISTSLFLGRKIPVAGGGYFRLFPYWFTKMALQKINNKDEKPFIFYFHPWEIDPEQPKMQNTKPLSRFRHYVNLNKTFKRLEQLLRDFSLARSIHCTIPQHDFILLNPSRTIQDNQMNFKITYFYLFLFFIIIICLQGHDSMANESKRFKKIKDISADQWMNLAQRNIYFGHQSVGFNIVAGIEDIIRENPHIKLNVLLETRKVTEIQNGIFAHSKIGQNTQSGAKIEDFARIISQENSGRFDMAFMKLCYVDIVAQTDVQKLFEQYKETMTKLKNTQPDLKITHFTVPLRTQKISWKAKVKMTIGKKPWELADNIRRNEFNQMLLQEYSGKEPVFDIAAYEAANFEGNPSIFRFNGKEYLSMKPEYSNDGGHLNEKGRKIIAEQLLIFLAQNI